MSLARLGTKWAAKGKSGHRIPYKTALLISQVLYLSLFSDAERSGFCHWLAKEIKSLIVLLRWAT